uniref:Uroporphyrinogen decarboxylase (URO-D) domain-containing protein n=1 Tax=Candidatus Caldatribacterium californiense TaxID=1454726 RepID=A0A7V3YHU9_9BACT
MIVPNLSLDEKKRFLQRFWRREERGPVFYIGSPARNAFQGNTLPSFEELLNLELSRLMARRHILDFDIPALRTDFGTGIFPSAFGCPLRYEEGRYPWSEPIIFDDPSAVYRLRKPSVTDGLLGRVLEFTRFAVQRTEGKFPIKMTDLQGPLDIVYLLWESNSFFLALFDAPQAVHHLLNIVTELLIEFVKAQKTHALGAEFIPCHLPHYIPWGEGICVSEDLLALLSPDLYREFALPYLNALSDEFGGIFIHSCGNFTQNLDVLCEVRGLKGVDFGATETPFENVVAKLGGKVVLSPHLGLNKDIHFFTVTEYLFHLKKVGQHTPFLYILVDTTNSLLGHDMCWRPEELEAIYTVFASWGDGHGE